MTGIRVSFAWNVLAMERHLQTTAVPTAVKAFSNAGPQPAYVVTVTVTDGSRVSKAASKPWSVTVGSGRCLPATAIHGVTGDAADYPDRQLQRVGRHYTRAGATSSMRGDFGMGATSTGAVATPTARTTGCWHYVVRLPSPTALGERAQRLSRRVSTP